MITIINYEMGNLFSVENAFKYLGYKTLITDDSNEIESSKIIVLPGVGSFHKAMKIIKSKKIDISIKESLKKGSKILGICLGMQLLASSSEEDGFSQGLRLINNEVKKFNSGEVLGLKIPHIGFNSVNSHPKEKLYKGIIDKSDFYFVHSYRISLDNEKIDDSIIYSSFNYGGDFVASFQKNKIYGTQFHPEKSQSTGLLLLKNFVELG
tara:strand:+ start:2297 stop:2923 length:627 start_codon:yes stop_codon:yes gene_type:complete